MSVKHKMSAHKTCQKEPSPLTQTCQKEPSPLARVLVGLVAVVLLGGCGQTSAGGQGTAAEKGQAELTSIYDVQTADAQWTNLQETFPSMLWGQYTYDEWVTSEGTGEGEKPAAKCELDEEKFCEGMKYLKCSVTLDGKATEVELTALPIQVTGAFPLGSSRSLLDGLQIKNKNPFETLWGSYFWKKPINNTWGLQEWEEEVHAAFLARFKNNDSWDNFKSLMQQNVIQMEFLTKEKNSAAASFLYRVEGNKLHLYEWEADPETFELSQKEWGVFEFCFSGRNLMLRREGCTLAYCPSAFSQKAKGQEQDVPYTDGYANGEEDVYQELLGFFWYAGDESKGTIDFADGGYAVEKSVKGSGDRLILQWTKRYRRVSEKLKLEEEPGEISFGYLWTEPFGVILVADGRYYRYQHSENHYYEEQLGENLGEGVAVGDLSEEELSRLLAERQAILEELQKAFEQAEIHVEIDPNGGKVTMDSSILFDVDEATISEEGKDYLNRFLEVYGAVVMDEKYADTISEIQVEGHTDTDGSYDHNLELSEKRADYVMKYCLEVCPKLEGKISAKGCSYDNPIYDAEGNVDKAASRRVVFKFKLRVGGEETE